MDRFEKNDMKKIRPIKNIWYDWLINYIPEPIRKSVGGFKDKIVSLFKTNKPKQTVYGRGKKLSQAKKKNIKKPFISEENKEKTKDIIFRDIWTLFHGDHTNFDYKFQDFPGFSRTFLDFFQDILLWLKKYKSLT